MYKRTCRFFLIDDLRRTSFIQIQFAIRNILAFQHATIARLNILFNITASVRACKTFAKILRPKNPIFLYVLRFLAAAAASLINLMRTFINQGRCLRKKRERKNGTTFFLFLSFSLSLSLSLSLILRLSSSPSLSLSLSLSPPYSLSLYFRG